MSTSFGNSPTVLPDPYAGHEQRNSELTKKAVSSSDELEIYPTALPEEVGSKLDEKGEKVPWYWRIYYAFFPGTKEEIRPWSFGVLMDVIFLFLIVVFLVALYHDEPEKVREAWFFPLLGIFAAIISTSTPAGTTNIFFFLVCHVMSHNLLLRGRGCVLSVHGSYRCKACGSCCFFDDNTSL